MKSGRLVLLLCYFMLWGADEALAARWLPQVKRPCAARRQVVPLSFRYREQLLRQVRALRRATVAPPPATEPSSPRSPVGVRRTAQRRPVRSGLLYTLMSLQR
jgi:hypothetical protein